MDFLDKLNNKLTNEVLVDNLSEVTTAFILGFIMAFLATPLVAKLALKIGAVDKPSNLRKKTDKTAERRIHQNTVPRLGGLAMFIAIFLGLIFTDTFEFLPRGVVLGVFIVMLIGFLDDRFEIDGKFILLGQIIAAFAVVLGGNTILSLDIGLYNFDFNWYSDLVLYFGDFTYNFIFPADIITILWIVGLINAVNWVGGVDALNGTVSSIATFTMLLIVLNSDNPNITLATLIAIHLGSIIGVLPYNYNPMKILYGSIGDFLNGYMLAVFAIFGSAKWAVTITILGMPIIDAIIVVLIRLRDHPEARRNPLKLLSISDKNHLHHRLLTAGYSVKTVVLIEMAIMFVLCTIAFWFSDFEDEYFAAFAGSTILLVCFTVIFFLKKRGEKNARLKQLSVNLENNPKLKKEAVVEVVVDESDQKDYERYIY